MNHGGNMQIEGFFDPGTWTVSYIVLDKATRRCALIDSVLDFDARSGRTSNASADRLLARVGELDGEVQWILETHVHADHLSAAPYLKAQLGGRLGIGAGITVVQGVFAALFNEGADFARDGRQSEDSLERGLAARRVPTC
jgi:glyoxylase-like metal-dependent hydrolase (beta-lactamase superfamily II)